MPQQTQEPQAQVKTIPAETLARSSAARYTIAVAAYLLTAYHCRLPSEDPVVRLAAAKIWSGWEGATSKLLPDAAFTSHYEEDKFALAFARIEAHYFVNKGFFEADDHLLQNALRFHHIPGVIVQGRYDVGCRWRVRGPCTGRGPRSSSSSLRIAATARSTRRTPGHW